MENNLNLYDDQGGTINDITNLKFYTGRGYEIPMQKTYVLQWEFIPGKLASKYLKAPLNGYFIGDIKFPKSDDSDTTLKILENSLLVQFINNGEFYVRFATEPSLDDNGIQVYSYNDIESSTGLLSSEKYYNYVSKLFLEEDNKIKVSINVKNKSFEHTFNVNDIFTLNGTGKPDIYTQITTIYTGENLSIIENGVEIANSEFYQTIGLTKIDLIKLDKSNTPVIQQIFEDSVPNIGVYFPFVRYAGDYYQDKVSANFIAADTILVLEEVRNEDDTFDYVTPYISASSSYSLVFQPENKGELKIIDKASEYEIKYKDEVAFALSNKQKNTNKVAEPFSFSIAFQATDEGAYQNLLGIYLTSKREESDTITAFFMGAISIKSEVEGEDERFRTLLTDFGVPDPKYYSNIFAEQDYQEQGKDFKLINKKSKELMLTYDQIFSYVGTYKALIRAIKFLGYQDIIFKEWYSIKDSNDKLTDIAIQVFDSSTGDFLKQKLASYNVSIEDFNNYNKLNRISMIYHFNEQIDNVEKIKTTYVKYEAIDSSHGEIVNASSALKYHTFISEVPTTQPIFIYRNEETLSKLFAVKQWLEQHIIGVGAYIADITGEGIYFSWQKTQGYQTQHYLNDFSQAQYYTADVKGVTEFVDSSAIVSCTLNELNNAVRFIDYEETPIAAFDKYDISINLSTDDGTKISVPVLTISNSIEAPVLGDEYEFDLVNRPDSGTLHEWMPKDKSDEILFQDGEIKFLFDETRDASIDSSCLPIITLENANIHNAYGNWRTNVKWMIREIIDPETGNTKYKLQNYKVYLANSNQKVVDQYVIIEPDIKRDASGNIIDMPYIKYSEKNKWDIPMFIIHGYKFTNIEVNKGEEEYYNLDCSANDYILEILKGDMLFKDRDNCGCQVSFTSDLIQTNYTLSANNTTYVNEQQIQPTYTYHSERKAFVNLDSSAIETESNTVIKCGDVLNEISADVSTNIINIYSAYLKNIKNCLPGISNKNLENDLAYLDTSLYIDSSNFRNEITEFIDQLQTAKQKELLDEALENIISKNYICNSSIPVKVTRLGEYELINRSFDKYNNMFPSKYDNKIVVTASPIPMDIYTSYNNSYNAEKFYKFNIDGSLQTPEQLNDILNKCENKAKYPKSYQIYNIDYNLDNDFVEFDNISYAIDTPKNNDFVVFNTMNERCVDISIRKDDTIRLMMLDENPNKIFLYADTSKEPSIQKRISIFVYDSLLKEFVYQVENADIIDCSLVNQENDINYAADSYIDISIDNISRDLLANYIDNQHKLFVLNTTEYPIDSSNIELDYDNKETYITFNCDQVFNPEDVIKIRYYMDVSTETIDREINKGQIINETAYRILDVSGINYDDKEEVYNGWVYTINGLPNTNLLNNDNVHACIMYAAQYPVKYTSKIIGRAYEFNEKIGLNNYSIIRDHFNFNSTQLFLNDYIDDTYGIEINDYDYINGEKYWLDFTSYDALDTSLEMYYYHQFPVTTTQGDNVIFRSHDIRNTFIPGYKVDWCVKVESVDELNNISENVNNNRKEILFRNVNNYLSVSPYMLGSHDIELTCTDIYGNRLTNAGEGMLYVKENKNKTEYYNYSYI